MSHSSSESESDSSSDDEENERPVFDQARDLPKMALKAMRERQEKQLPSPLMQFPKKAMPSENDEKVRNTRNTSQEKENHGTQNIIDYQVNPTSVISGAKDSNLRSEENKKAVLKKLEVLNHTNQSATKRQLRSRDVANHSCSSPSALTSDDGDTSSGGQEVRRIIANDAVARRHQANLARQQLSKEKERPK